MGSPLYEGIFEISGYYNPNSKAAQNLQELFRIHCISTLVASPGKVCEGGVDMLTHTLKQMNSSKGALDATTNYHFPKTDEIMITCNKSQLSSLILYKIEKTTFRIPVDLPGVYYN